MVYKGDIHNTEISLQLYKFNDSDIYVDDDYSFKDLNGFPEDGFQYWLNLHGIHDTDLINDLATRVDIHPLVIQDILDTNQRPKFQDFDNYWFFTIKSVTPETNIEDTSEQLSFVLGHNYLISFQEKKADHFSHIRYRLENHVGKIRERSVDYLLYLLLEAILDNYFKTIIDLRNKIDEQSIRDLDQSTSPELLKVIEAHKRDIHQLKSTIVPIKEFIQRLEHEKFGLINADYIKYYYELKDICMSLIDECEYINLKLESQTNMFFSQQGHKMNQIMKTLTVVATIFIPLTFVAGIYGMNFENMPELSWKYGYVGVWSLMIILLVFMVFYIKRKKWY